MSTGDSILGTRLLDILSRTSNPEVATFGNYGTGTYLRLYDQNNVDSGAYFGFSNRTLLACNVDGTAATLTLQGTLRTSNFASTNANKTIYFENGTNLLGLSNIDLTGTIFKNGEVIKLGGGSGGVSDYEFIACNVATIGILNATVINPTAPSALNVYTLPAVTTAVTDNKFVQKYIYTQGSNYSFRITTSNLNNSFTYNDFTQLTTQQELEFIWTSNAWSYVYPYNATGIDYRTISMYNPTNATSRTIQTNDATAANRVLFSFSMPGGRYYAYASISYSNLDDIVPIDATNWVRAGIYNASVLTYSNATPVQQYVPLISGQQLSFNFYIDTIDLANSDMVIALTGVGQRLEFTAATTKLKLVPVQTARGLGSVDNVTVRRAIQINPVRGVFNPATAQTAFTLTMTGNFTVTPQYTDVYINGVKYIYKDASNKDYDVAATYSSLTGQTSFVVTLTQAATSGDLVEIVVWPTSPATDYYATGYFYQQNVATSTPWQNVSGGGVRCTSHLVCDGDMYVRGNIYGGCNTALFTSGVTFDSSIADISSNVIGTVNIIDGAVTPAKLNLIAGNVGIGTDAALQRLDVAGNLRVAGAIYDYSNQPIWLPSTSLRWANTLNPPQFALPAGASFSYSASNGRYRWIGNDLTYNVYVAGTLMAAATSSASDFRLSLPYPLDTTKYSNNLIIGELWLSVYSGVNSNTFKTYARTISTDANNVTIRVLTGTTDEAMGALASGAIITLQGTMSYATSSINQQLGLSESYIPANFAQDQTGQVGLNLGTNAPRGRLDIYASNASPVLVVDQGGTGDVIQIKDMGVNKFVVDMNGNVGVGTAPVAPVHIVANSATTGMIFDQRGAGNIMEIQDYGATKITIDGSGNIGIGTTLPKAPFYVNGDLYITGRYVHAAGTGIPSNPYFYYNFLGVNGTNVPDASGNNRPATTAAYATVSGLIGTTTTLLGDVVGTYQFTQNQTANGFNYLAPNTAINPVAGEKTISFWVKTTRALSVNDDVMIGFGYKSVNTAAGTAKTAFSCMWGVGSIQDIGFWGQSWDVSFGPTVNTNITCNHNQWVHFTLIKKLIGSSYVMIPYINGKRGIYMSGSADTYDTLYSLAATDTALEYRLTQGASGIASNGVFTFRGLLYYTRALDDFEVMQIYYNT